MSLVVYLGEVLEVKVRIYLGRAYICVAQQFLDAAQIMARFKQMRCEGVPEQVRINPHIDALPPCPVADPGLHRAAAQAIPLLADKQGPFFARGKLPA